MAKVKLEHIKKIYPNGFEAVKDFSLDIEDEEFVIFVGPSGCGKTTTLRMIAGLEQLSEGELWIDEKRMNDVEPRDRDIAMVFQSYALYPHMSVYDNMAFALKLKHIDKKIIEEAVMHAADILNLKELLKRKPSQLCGGQRQRVAMGRAIVRNPKVFLMDEPLSNLDAKLRVQMRSEIYKLHQRLKATIIYVTHDQTEAMTLGTRIVVMDKGEIMQQDTPMNLYHRPQNCFVAGFIGSPQMNFIETQCMIDENQVYLMHQGQSFVVSSYLKEKLIKGNYHEKEVILGIRPEDLKIQAVSQNSIQGKIIIKELLGYETSVRMAFYEKEITAMVSSEEVIHMDHELKLYLDMNHVHLFDAQTKQAIAHAVDADLDVKGRNN